MAENVEGWGGFIKTLSELKPRYLFVFWFPCALLIFSPLTLLERLGIANFVDQYRGWIGLAGIVFFVLWLVQLYSTASDSWKKRSKNKQSDKDIEEYKESVIKYLYNNSLSPGEGFFIAYALYKKQQVIYVNYTNQYAQALVHKGLLSTPGTGPIHNYPFMIPDFIWEHLQSNKDKLLPQQLDERQKFLQLVESYDYLPEWQKDSIFR